MASHHVNDCSNSYVPRPADQAQPAPSLPSPSPQSNSNALVTPSQGKSRAARNTSSSKASRNRKKLGRPKVHWTKRASLQRRRCPKRLRRVEVANLFAADRFASKIGLRFTTFITIRWSLTERGEADIHKRWQALLNKVNSWARRQGFELAHCWVHENPPRDEPAFNTHLLANIPPDLRVAFTEWLVKQLGGYAGAIDVQPRTCPGWNKPDDRVSYMAKGCDWATARKKEYSLIRKHGWDGKQGVIEFKRSGTSRNINAKARQAGERPTGTGEFCDQYARARAA